MTELLYQTDAYLKEFDAGFVAEENPARKRNAGRRRANTWLREKLENETSDDQ